MRYSCFVAATPKKINSLSLSLSVSFVQTRSEDNS